MQLAMQPVIESIKPAGFELHRFVEGATFGDDQAFGTDIEVIDTKEHIVLAMKKKPSASCRRLSVSRFCKVEVRGIEPLTS